jgi:hypothetical protein
MRGFKEGMGKRGHMVAVVETGIEVDARFGLRVHCLTSSIASLLLPRKERGT